MTRILLTVAVTAALIIGVLPRTMRSQDHKPEKSMKPVTLNKLTPEEARVIIDKGTELAFTGKYYKNTATGVYTCKQCGAELFLSHDKFDAGCGWPSFDDAIPGAVKRTLAPDAIYPEITCARCGAHLGHVFEGEGFTPKDTRYCVNSISMNFIPADDPKAAEVKTDTAYFAGGCFWGTEYLLQQADGVITAHVGYMGGHTAKPSYREVCEHGTGHAEAVEVIFDPSKTTYEKLAKYFFEIHDPTQMDRQGPDVGDQYRSEIFYVNDAQKETAQKLIDILKAKGYKVVTRLAKADKFWLAEDYHQDYYKNNGEEPYCHVYTKRF